MSKKHSPQTVKKDVMKMINSGDIKPKSKNYYLSLTILLIAGSLALIGLAGLAISILVQDDQVGRDLETIGVQSGSSQTGPLLLTMILITVGVIGSVWILRKFRHGYRHRYAALYAAVIVTLGLFTLVSVQAGVADNLSRRGPFDRFAPLSKEFSENHKTGSVVSIEEDKIVISAGEYEEEVTITVTEETVIRSLEDIKEGDNVIVKGKKAEVTKDTDESSETETKKEIEAKHIIVNPEKSKYKKFHPKFRRGEIREQRDL